METIQGPDFEKLDIRVGTIIDAREFPQARKPAYQLTVDFGESGVKKSSAQITTHYLPADLIGRQVIGLLNLPVRQIANFFSECLILGIYDTTGAVVLLQPERPVDNGARIG